MRRKVLVMLIPVAAGGVVWLGAEKGRENGAFVPPDRDVRRAAVGETRFLPETEASAFAESSLFSPKKVPGASDWLANHREPGQTFDQFLRTRRNRFQPPRDVLYIQPIGEFPEREKAVLDRMKEYAGLFFQAEVTIQEPLDPARMKITERRNRFSGERQFLTTDILRLLERDLPKDAYARLAVTMTDLYPDPSWNFVFGQASLRDRTGVYSFARYGEPGTPEFLRRCARVFTHETGHMFAISHCVHFQCLMNGSNHLDESDDTPLQLCPVCLRKLHTANPFDIGKRYRALGEFFRENGLESDAKWMERRLGEIE